MPRPRSRTRYDLLVDRTPGRLTPRVVPAVDPWLAGEMFVSAHIEERRRGFAILFGSEAARRSPLTPQLLASRVDEPDMPLRVQILHGLADYFEIRGREYRYPPEMRALVAGHLRKFDRQQVLALVEAHCAGANRTVRVREESLARLLERIPNAALHLTRMAGDRSLRIGLRQSAIELIGLVGFADAVESLGGLLLRIEGRRAGQLTLGFAPSDNPDEQYLLPALKDTLRLLREND